ncbi:MAG: ATP-binding protein [Christensenellales bacterium]
MMLTTLEKSRCWKGWTRCGCVRACTSAPPVRGLHHLLWEIVDNAIDEGWPAMPTEIAVTLHKDGSASVRDNGRGVPVDKHPQLGISGVEVIYTSCTRAASSAMKTTPIPAACTAWAPRW